MTNKEKYEFLDSIKFDPLFRKEVVDLLIDTTELRDQVADLVSDRHYEQFKMMLTEAVSEVESEAVKDLEATFENRVILTSKHMLQDKDDLITSVADKVAKELLTYDGKKQLKEKVEKAMMRQRSHRPDLLDLDEEHD